MIENSGVQFGMRVSNANEMSTVQTRMLACDPCEKLVICQRTYDLVSATLPITGFTIDNGTEHVVEFSKPIDPTSATFQTDLAFAVQCDLRTYEVNLHARFIDGVFTHISQNKITSFTLSDGTTVDVATESCNQIYVCDWRVSVVGAVPPITIAGVEYTLATGTYDITGTAATDEATAATLKTDVENVLTSAGIVFSEVVITVSDDGYVVTIKATSPFSATVGDKAIAFCGSCCYVFLVADDTEKKVAEEKKVAASEVGTKVVPKSSKK